MTGSLFEGVLTLLFIEFYWVQMSSYLLAMHSYQRVFMNHIKSLLILNRIKILTTNQIQFETFQSSTIWGKQHIRTSVKYLNRPKWKENTNCHSIVVSRYCFKSWSNFKPSYEHRWSFSNENYGIITAFGPSTDNKTGMKVSWLAEKKDLWPNAVRSLSTNRISIGSYFPIQSHFCWWDWNSLPLLRGCRIKFQLKLEQISENSDLIFSFIHKCPSIIKQDQSTHPNRSYTIENKPAMAWLCWTDVACFDGSLVLLVEKIVCINCWPFYIPEVFHEVLFSFHQIHWRHRSVSLFETHPNIPLFAKLCYPFHTYHRLVFCMWSPVQSLKL